MNLQIIAIAHNGFSDKFGIPRQSRPDSQIETRIVFEPAFRDGNLLRGIEGYSHLWLLWEFSRGNAASQNEELNRPKGLNDELIGRSWKATVRPPRLGGNTRMGVFATRSPFRPNPIGLTSVELIRIEKTAEGMVLVVRGADLMDGTPIYDIKPYLTYSDCHPEARNGFGEEHKDYKLKVEWLKPYSSTPLPPYSQIEEILSQDPRPGYQEDPERVYKLDYAGWHVEFRVEEGTAYVFLVKKVE